MTEKQYLEKRAKYSTSNASKEVIDKAIKDLDAKWLELTASKRAYTLYEDSKADISDINNN